MIQITLNTFMGMEKLFGGRKSQLIALPESSTVRHLLQEITVVFGVSLTEDPQAEIIVLKEDFTVMVNGVSILAKEGFDTGLSDGDRVLFFPPMAGG